MKKKYIILSICIVCLLAVFVSLNAASQTVASGYQPLLSEIDTKTNFFTQVDSKTEITYVDERDAVLAKGYVEMAQTDDLILYLDESKLAIAVYDKHKGYMWYSTYKGYEDLELSDRVKAKIESGVTIEYFDTNSKTITNQEFSFTLVEGTDTTPKGSATVSKITNGFSAKVKFKKVGISFEVRVQINGDTLNVSVPYNSIKEEKIVKAKKEYTYLLKSITLFPYLGSENYRINGYSFIPDGSGALIRYTDTKSSTGFVKRVYGNDYGIQEESTLSNHMKNPNSVSLPIYGVSHGYNQVAYLCEIQSGAGACELHSYPYMYNNLGINTTFFKFHTRERFTVTLSSSNNLTLIGDYPYPNDYSLKYSFLQGNEANYVGMANKYRESLNVEEKEMKNEQTPLHLTVLGVDYKDGLFGKNYIPMTTFEDTLDILKDMKIFGVNNFQVTYLGWNKGGYFNNGATNARIASQLGSKDDLEELQSYINEKNYSIDYTVNPLVSDTYGLGNETIKKINMSAYEVLLESSLVQEQYYVNPSSLSKLILNKASRYKSLGIDSFNIDTLDVSFSYRADSKEIYREEMIKNLQAELEKLDKYTISTSKPNGYLLDYVSNYYDTPYESSKYLYETDSVPFIQILLSGYVDMFATDLNYISDVELMNLRMIEYNLYPSVLVTSEEAYKLRFTNFEYLNSTQYDLWKGLVGSSYVAVSNALDNVRGAKIVGHEYIAAGVCKVTYDNLTTIYINYNNSDYSDSNVSIEPYQYLVVRG